MAKEFNLEESNAYFASDKIKDFVKQQSQFDKLMMSRSVRPIAAFDFLVGFTVFSATQAATHEYVLPSALFFATVFCCSAYSLNLFSIRCRFDRWQSLLLCLKAWILAYAFTLGFSPLWIGEDAPTFLSTTVGAVCSGIIIYVCHWYLARGMRRHAFHFVIIGEPTPTTISLLKEVRRPREVVSYRHIHKLYRMVSSQRGLEPAQVIQALIQNDISTIVITSNHTPTPTEELLLIEAQQKGVDCISEEDLWEDVTKCAILGDSKRGDFLKTLQIDIRPGQNFFRRILELSISIFVLIFFFPIFCIFYVTASMRKGSHAIDEQWFLGANHIPFKGKVLIFSPTHSDAHKELKIGQYGQNSFLERWSWKSGIWKYPLLLNVIKGELGFVGSPLKSSFHTSPQNTPRANFSHEASLEQIIDKTLRPGIISHFELVEQEPTYFESPNRSHERYTLYYHKHRSLLLDMYMVGLCLLNKFVGRSPQRAWLEG